jgi:hypothetical protein
VKQMLMIMMISLFHLCLIVNVLERCYLVNYEVLVLIDFETLILMFVVKRNASPNFPFKDCKINLCSLA